MTLDVFDIKLGRETKPRIDDDSRGLVAVKVLDAVQTVVDVLTDNDGGSGWKVSFDPGLNAYTDRVGGKRNIVVSGMPLTHAKVGTPLADIAAVMTGFAVHEVGHTKLDFFGEVTKRWPNKRLPVTLANIIEDVVLEARTTQHYAGFADHGEGNIFKPTLEWVAERTCPKTPLEWSGSTGHKVNVTGQIVRYRDYVTFSQDPVTQTHLRWVEGWMQGITPDLTAEGCVTLIEQWFDYVKATLQDDLPQEEPEPESGPGPSGQSLPSEDEGESEGEGKGDEPGEDTTDGGEGDGEDGDSEDDAEGDGSGGSEDGDTEGGSEDDESGDTEGGSTSERSGDGNDADHGARTDAPKGANDGDGAGGSGQAVSEAGDPVDDLDDGEADLPTESFDDLARDTNSGTQQELARSEELERTTTRLDAGMFGKMRVIFR